MIITKTVYNMESRKEIDSKGTLRYYNEKDLLHNENGPAVVFKNGTKIWQQNDLLHRLDGPAVIWSNGDKEWWIKGKQLTEEEYRMREYTKTNLTIESLLFATAYFVSQPNIKEQLMSLYFAHKSGDASIPENVSIIERHQMEPLSNIIHYIEILAYHYENFNENK